MQLETKKDEQQLISDDLVNQIRLKVEIVQVYQSYVSEAIATIEDSQKLIDVTATDGNGRVMMNKKLSRDEVTTHLQQSSGMIRLPFHSFKCHDDVWKDDQALGSTRKTLEGRRTRVDPLSRQIRCILIHQYLGEGYRSLSIDRKTYKPVNAALQKPTIPTIEDQKA